MFTCYVCDVSLYCFCVILRKTDVKNSRRTVRDDLLAKTVPAIYFFSSISIALWEAYDHWMIIIIRPMKNRLSNLSRDTILVDFRSIEFFVEQFKVFKTILDSFSNNASKHYKYQKKAGNMFYYYFATVLWSFSRTRISNKRKNEHEVFLHYGETTKAWLTQI